jgi:hypothetical protein
MQEVAPSRSLDRGMHGKILAVAWRIAHQQAGVGENRQSKAVLDRHTGSKFSSTHEKGDFGCAFDHPNLQNLIKYELD